MTPAEPMFDTLAVANDLRRRHGAAAVDLASRRAKEHLQKASWMAGAQWLRVVSHLKSAAATDQPSASSAS
jgi:hypothetical protein